MGVDVSCIGKRWKKANQEKRKNANQGKDRGINSLKWMSTTERGMWVLNILDGDIFEGGERGCVYFNTEK